MFTMIKDESGSAVAVSVKTETEAAEGSEEARGGDGKGTLFERDRKASQQAGEPPRRTKFPTGFGRFVCAWKPGSGITFTSRFCTSSSSG